MTLHWLIAAFLFLPSPAAPCAADVEAPASAFLPVAGAPTAIAQPPEPPEPEDPPEMPEPSPDPDDPPPIPEPPGVCCFSHPEYAGVCIVELAERETCASVLAYLNDPRSAGKTYCNRSDLRGGWKSVPCE